MNYGLHRKIYKDIIFVKSNHNNQLADDSQCFKLPTSADGGCLTKMTKEKKVEDEEEEEESEDEEEESEDEEEEFSDEEEDQEDEEEEEEDIGSEDW